MADDIVTRLRELMTDLLYNPECDDEGCGDCAWHRVGADAISEIERLEFERDEHRDAARAYKAEIERLRAEFAELIVAGTKLADMIVRSENEFIDDEEWDNTIKQCYDLVRVSNDK